MVCCLLTLNLAQSRGGPWIDAAAALTFVVAALTLESGLLVWVVAAAAWLAGCRGISRRGIAAMTVLLGAYFYLSFVYLSIRSTGFGGQGSGFLLRGLEPAEQRALFGDPPLIFFAYNVAASLGSVLLSEPRNGVFVGVRAWLQGQLPPRVWLEIGSSLVTSALLGWIAVRMAKDRELRSDEGRLLFVCAAVVAANAALCFAYTKDEIMSTAGAFYAIAVYVAMRRVLARPRTRGPLRTAALALMLVVIASAWAVRSAGLHHVLRSQAFKHRVDWALLPTLWKQDGRWPTDQAAQRLILDLRSDALAVPVPNPYFDPHWAYSVWAD